LTQSSPVRLIVASAAHIGPVGVRMRDADRRECAAFGFSPKGALRRSLAASTLAVTAMIDGRPEAMMGVEVRSAVEGLGCPWMLATDAAYARGRDLVTIGPGLIDYLADSMRRLAGVVGADNIRAVRVLKRWGFTVGDEIQMIGAMPFLPFEMIR
jgi:hypothetical protein